MMITTTNSSTKVKPACSLLRFLELWIRWNSARWASSFAWKREVMGVSRLAFEYPASIAPEGGGDNTGRLSKI